MSEKVLGFLKKEIVGQNKFTYIVEKDKLVPVVSLEWLEQERDKIREYNSDQTEKSDFMRGWLKGSSDGAEALFEAAKKQASEKR